VTDTAVPHRAEGWNMAVTGVWMDPATTDANVAWARETLQALGPHLDTRRWGNYLGDDEGANAVRDAYGPNWDRLVEVKRRYDPDNVFHHNLNIDPS
jgi:FAD/FMN-containing dehydrogenase